VHRDHRKLDNATLGFTIITGNQYKADEFKRLLPENIKFTTHSFNLEEIQNLDGDVIIKHKLRQAYAQLQSPVFVEDVSAGLDELGGLPGPFIKYFEQLLGDGALFKLVHHEYSAKIVSTIGYTNGTREIIAHGVVRGTIVAPRSQKSNGFGFDCCFVPNGKSKTYSEMTSAEKDRIGHRGIAVSEFLKKLDNM
jgi:non-canonical purine NTP pyrophosphatase (RdgB/HAM1 family)